MTAARVLRLAANEMGRDFVVGDIHGAFGLLDEALRQVGFDEGSDRLFIVGDLIDRGPESHRVVDYLSRPCVYAVQGNHEAMLLDLYAEGEPDEHHVVLASKYNGLGWWPSVGARQRKVILEALRTLPTVIEIESPEGIIGIMHADVPVSMTWSQFVGQVEAGNRSVIEFALWGRDRLDHQFPGGIAGVHRVFVGHTPQRDGAVVLGNVIGIDTGAVFGALGKWPEGHLTLVESRVALERIAAPRENTGQVRIIAGHNGRQTIPRSRWALFS